MSGRAGLRLGLTIVGAVIGGVAFGSTGAQVGALVGSIAGSLIFPDKPIKRFQQIGSSLKDERVTISEYGRGIPECDGTVRLGLNVVWISQPEPEVSQSTSSEGGKGGGGGGVESTQQIIRNFVDLFAVFAHVPDPDRPVGDILQVYRNGDLIFDQRSGNGADNPLADRLDVTLFDGSPDQLPPAVIEAIEGAGNVPGYRYQGGVLIRHIEVTVAPIEFQGLQVVVNMEPRTAEVLMYSTGSAPGVTGDANRLGADFARGFIYCDADGFTKITQYDIATKEPVRILEPEYHDDVTFIAVDPRNGDILYRDGAFDIVRIDNLAGAEISRTTNTPGENLQATTLSFVVTLEVPFGTFGVLVHNAAANDWRIFDLDSLMFIQNIADGTQAQGGCPGLPGTGLGYICHQTTTETILRKITLLPAIDENSGEPVVNATVEVIATVAVTDIDPAAASQSLGSRLFFDSATGRVFFGASLNTGEYLVGFEEGVGVLQPPLQVGSAPGALQGSGSNRIAGGSIAWTTNTGADLLFRVNISNNTLSDPPLDGSVPGYGGGEVVPPQQIYDDVTNSFYWIRGDSSLGQLVLAGRPPATVSVGTIIERRCFGAGIDAYGPQVKIDPALFSDSIGGNECSPPFDGAGVIELYAKLFQFDGRQSGFRLEFLKRGGAVVATIPYTEFIRPSRDEDSFKRPKVNARQIPAEVVIRYRDMDRDYQTNVASYRRPTDPFGQQNALLSLPFDVPGSISESQAIQAAQMAINSAVLEQEGLETIFGPERNNLDAADPILVQLPDRSMRVRLVEAPLGADNALRVRAVREDPGQFVSTLPSDGGTGLVAQSPTLPTGADLFLFSVPYLADADFPGSMNLLLYWCALSFAPQFNGATLLGGPDVASLTALGGTVVPAPFGGAENALGQPGDYNTLDTVNTLTVSMAYGGDQLASCTMDELLAGANAFALRNAVTGKVSILQFMTVAALGGERYTLSDLLHGRRGTEVLGQLHGTGDRFVLLVPGAVRTFTLSIAALNAGRTYKLVASGQTASQVLAVGFASPGNDLKPLALVNFSAVKTAGGDIKIFFNRRTRLGGELVDLTGDVPLAEARELYRADFFASPDPDTETRADRLNSVNRDRTDADQPVDPDEPREFLYDGDDYATDFGVAVPAAPFDLTFRLRQIGGIVGADIDGFFLEQTLTVVDE